MTKAALLGTITYVYICMECNNLQRFPSNGRCEICRSYNIQSLQRIIEEYTIDMAHLKPLRGKIPLYLEKAASKKHDSHHRLITMPKGGVEKL